MVTRRLLSRFLTVVGLLTLCLGATSSSCSLNDGDSGSSDEPSFVTKLTLQDSDGNVTSTFSRSEPITMVLTVRNRLGTTATVQVPVERNFDFVVVRENSDSLVWQDSNGEPFSTEKIDISFAAGESKTYTRIWNQLNADGALVRAGSYEARGALVYDGFDSAPLKTNQTASTLERFTIN